MDLDRITQRMGRFPRVLETLLDGMDESDGRWKPAPEHWSVVEIVCHLADEEVEDFRQRLRLTIESPETEWPTIDPQQAVIDRRYNQQSLADSLHRFSRERETSLDWLRSLENVDWSCGHNHPRVGLVPAGSLLASWVAHDQLHMRQIARRLYDLSARDASPFPNDYAGDW